MVDAAAPAVRQTGTTSLVDLLDRVVDRGAVISGDVVIGLAGIDLIRLDLRVLLIALETSIETSRRLAST